MHKRKVPLSSAAPQELIHLLTVEQVAATLQVGRSTVYELINHEGLPYVLVGKMKRVPASSLQWWLKQREQGDHPGTNDLVYPQATEKGKKGPVGGSMYQRRTSVKITSPRDSVQ